MSYAPGFSTPQTSRDDFASAASPLVPEEPTRPFSIRLSKPEKERLKAAAGKRPLGVYIRDKLFDGSETKRRHRRNVDADARAIARLGAMLGQTRIANNLNQLAKLANMGSFPVDDGVTSDLKEACAHIAEIRATLLQALGQKRD